MKIIAKASDKHKMTHCWLNRFSPNVCLKCFFEKVFGYNSPKGRSLLFDECGKSGRVSAVSRIVGAQLPVAQCPVRTQCGTGGTTPHGAVPRVQHVRLGGGAAPRGSMPRAHGSGRLVIGLPEGPELG